MTISVSAATPLPGVLAHIDAVRASVESCASDSGPSRGVECGMCHELRAPATWCMDSEVGEYAVCASCNMPQGRRIVQDRAEQDLDVRPDSQAPASGPRRMIAVTVALSEPMDSAPLDWADTIAANLRLLYANTTVEVIDSWRVDA